MGVGDRIAPQRLVTPGGLLTLLRGHRVPTHASLPLAPAPAPGGHHAPLVTPCDIACAISALKIKGTVTWGQNGPRDAGVGSSWTLQRAAGVGMEGGACSRAGCTDSPPLSRGPPFLLVTMKPAPRWRVAEPKYCTCFCKEETSLSPGSPSD